MREIAPAEWVESAHLRLDDARFLLDDGRFRTATPQIYYALYYACRGLLEAEDFHFERHASVTSNIGRIRRYRERLDTSFPTAMQYRRERCDYDLFTPDRASVHAWVDKAENFIIGAETLLSWRVDVIIRDTVSESQRRLLREEKWYVFSQSRKQSLSLP